MDEKIESIEIRVNVKPAYQKKPGSSRGLPPSFGVTLKDSLKLRELSNSDVTFGRYIRDFVRANLSEQTPSEPQE